MIDFNTQTAHQSLDFDSLKTLCLSCENCRLSEQRTNVVFGSGRPDSDVMIIGEGPGANEDEQGVPFIGRAGQLLTKILESVGIDRDEDVFITNIVKCRPPKNRAPHLDEVEQCKGYLIRQIQLIKPKVIILLGAPALKTVLEEPLAISKVRGQWYQAEVAYMDEPLYIMPMFHPSYLLRHERKEKGSPKWLTWQDIREVKVAVNFYQKTNQKNKKS